MDRIFTGLCVGGPKDGEMLTHTAPVYNVIELEDASVDLSAASAKSEELIPLKITQYRHHVGIGDRDGGIIDFWLREGATVRDAVKALVRHYQEPGK